MHSPMILAQSRNRLRPHPVRWTWPGKDEEYATTEVDAFLNDPERSTDYMMKFAFAEVWGCAVRVLQYAI